ncbi:hypothetical protein [Labrenzia sp. 011]|uniref:hypothetical protein n=1 Tax=Labrenzia sp. 011 TaxID=2171494 RepID=UPI001403053B|nr:hypothetical protein [Labrenzia sp. 011]
MQQTFAQVAGQEGRAGSAGQTRPSGHALTLAWNLPSRREKVKFSHAVQARGI